MKLSGRCKDYSKIENKALIFIRPTHAMKKDGSVLWEIECRHCHKIFTAAPNKMKDRLSCGCTSYAPEYNKSLFRPGSTPVNKKNQGTLLISTLV